MGVVLAAVTDDPVDPTALLALVGSRRAGAVASFVGQVRDHDREASGEVTGIEYTRHPDADAVMTRIVGRVTAQLDPGDEALVAAAHRVGRLAVGDVALAVCVATPHRAPAFALCAQIVEAIKAELPIWKRQVEADGRAIWSGLGLG